MKTKYEKPTVRIVEFASEKGFAASCESLTRSDFDWGSGGTSTSSDNPLGHDIMNRLHGDDSDPLSKFGF